MPLPKVPTMIKKFDVGQCVATQGAMAALEENGQFPIVFIARHQSGDWGELSAEDNAANEAALIPDAEGNYARILSAYRLKDDTKIWLITEWDRSVTIILLPDEY